MKTSHPEAVPIVGAPLVNVPATEGPKVYTVREITRRIKNFFDSQFPTIWVEGEISDFKHHQSGHMYFNLKDSEATLKVAFFSRHNRQVKFELKNGLQVLCFGKISIYEQRGEYQLYLEQVEPKGLGSLQLEIGRASCRERV